jgi:peptidoglycan lytic transglycosylase
MKAPWRVAALALLLAVFFLQSCGKKKVSAAHPSTPVPSKVKVPKIGDTEEGVASWYGHPYHGRAAANGEIYDMEKLTAAHRTLPFNTWVRVENIATGQKVDLRIIDRGPFVNNRIIDVSHAAAEQIGLLGPGTARVRVVVIRPPVLEEAYLFAVQVGIFRSKENADKLRDQMQARFGSARAVERQGAPPVWRVLVGQESSPEKAEALAARVRGDTSIPEAFVVRLDLQ